MIKDEGKNFFEMEAGFRNFEEVFFGFLMNFPSFPGVSAVFLRILVIF